ncbi:hypothetical protein [Pararhizobium antarcticum]|nr:hypothetical protein [Pararhizobium antarcticum]
MTRPDPAIRTIIQIFPPSEVSPAPNQWLRIAATIFFAIAVGIAVQL